jgi:D-glycero-D-manno-heptose 1,7-bisphosphate phosphatase
MHPAIFLDRDGVLIENRSDYVRSWSQVTIFPEAIRALTNLPDNKYKIVIVTNQSAVGRRLISLETARAINGRLIDEIEKNGIQVGGLYMCPHSPDEQCNCRKPQPGLLLQAAQELSLDLSASWMIGDAWSDLLAGQAAGVRGVVMVRTGRGEEQLLQTHPENLKDHLIFDDLSKALEAIIQLDNDRHAQPGHA